MKKLAYKWNMTPQALSIFLTIIGLIITTLITILTVSWNMSSKFTSLEKDNINNLVQHEAISRKLDTLSIIAVKAFENSKKYK